MADQKMIRLNQAARELNVGIATIRDLLSSRGYEIGSSPNVKIPQEQYEMLEREFESSKALKKQAHGIQIGSNHDNMVIDANRPANKKKVEEEPLEPEEDVYIINESTSSKPTAEEVKKPEEPKKEEVTPEVEEPSSVKEEKEKPKAKEVAPKAEEIQEIPSEEPSETTKEPKDKKQESAEQPPADATKPEEESNTPEEPETISNKLPGLTVVDKIDLSQFKTGSSKAPYSPRKRERAQPAKKVEFKRNTENKPSTENRKREEPKREESTSSSKQLPTEPREERKVFQEKPKQGTPEKKEPFSRAKPVEQPKATTPKTTKEEESADDSQTISAKADKLQGLRVVGKIDLPVGRSKGREKPIASSDDSAKRDGKRKRKRVKVAPDAKKPAVTAKDDKFRPKRKGKDKRKEEVSEKEVDASYKKTLSQLSGGKTVATGRGASKAKYRKEKRDARAATEEARIQEEKENELVLKVAEFISVNELAVMMEVTVNDVISKAMQMGLIVSINLRLDAEKITLLADEFGFDVEFTSAEEEIDVQLDDTDKEEDLRPRAPIVTIMGHVDHGKTSLLDFIRKSKVAEGEAGGITQHIGAYDVETSSGKRIAFLDTPGHEAFTAMRARGAKLTDVAIIVIAADDDIMPQTEEAINHAQVAGVPLVFAINKIDKPGANPNKVKESLANRNILVEEWGGKYQCYEISAKFGTGIDDLLEGVLLEAEVLELQANPSKKAVGTVVEASLDKGRGYVATVLVQAGTLSIGDTILAGQHYGKVKAMLDHRGVKMNKIGPSTPVQVLGLSGAPQAGDKLNVLDSDREAREIANKREQILREQTIRATKRTTLTDIGRRIQIGNFQQLNIILKGDVDGSVEALTDALQKLTTEEVEVNIIHKAVGPISESDILLASASDAIVIGFQVRPTTSAKKLAEREDVEIRIYSIIYHAIQEIKLAMEGMLAPTVEEIIVGNVEVRDTFRITKVGTIAGCYVTEGYIKRNSKIRLIRDGIVVYGGETGGEIQTLKRFKDDVNEVRQGFECGLNIRGYNDVKTGDVIEVFEQKEIKRTLA